MPTEEDNDRLKRHIIDLFAELVEVKDELAETKAQLLRANNLIRQLATPPPISTPSHPHPLAPDSLTIDCTVNPPSDLSDLS